MAKFRKRPIVVEAEQLQARSGVLPEDVICVPAYSADNYNYLGNRFYIDTLEGRMEMKDGDWVITGIKGERYACNNEIFQLTYEPVTEEE